MFSCGRCGAKVGPEDPSCSSCGFVFLTPPARPEANVLEPDDSPSEEKGTAFLVIFRSFVALCVVVCGFLVFDQQSPIATRIGAGVIGAIGILLILGVRRYYAISIGVFCLIFGAFGTVLCVTDSTCASPLQAVSMLTAAAVFVIAFWAAATLPLRRSLYKAVRAAAIVGIITMFYVGNFSRAFGGAILFLLMGIGVLASALWEPKGGPLSAPEQQPVQPSRHEPPSPATMALASAAYWFAANERGWLTAAAIVIIGAVWLYAISRQDTVPDSRRRSARSRRRQR